ncbi:hypothetical protein JOF53_003427 [Crossiella equi]|uniref:Lipoprotein n=1 Tax=Crossiella equi TaxID=130796 RepID=A0ABS5ADA1_9PSEU|nr:hypothetical protein [Crossiella equi]MBP2474555.1 hypothetical protein [Crossiella equi]
MRTILLASASLLVLTACTSAPPPGPTVPELPKAGSVQELVTKLNEGIQAKKSASVQSFWEVKGREGGPSHTRAEGILRADGGDRVSRKVEAHGDTGLELPEGIFFKSAEAEGKPWERLDLANKESATNLVAVRGLVAMNDPTRTAEVLQLGGKIDSAAQEEMSNVQTVKYQVSVDLAKARDLSEDPITKAMLKTRTAKERSTAVHEIWLTADHVPVRWKVTELAKDGKGEIVDSVYTDWGRTFDLAPPPADQIQK